MTRHEIALSVRFGALHLQNAVLAIVQNTMVTAHVRATSQIATPNIAEDMWRETLELGIRRLEFKRYSVIQRRNKVGEEIVK